MIYIIEPQCKFFTHEKVNSGFITGICRAFKDQEVVVFADTTHIEALINILAHDKVNLDNLVFSPINLGKPSEFWGSIKVLFILKNLFKTATKNSVNQLFFLSYNPIILRAINYLSKKLKFTSLNFSIVLHGGFEDIEKEKGNLPKVPPVKLRTYTHIRSSGTNKFKSLTVSEFVFKVTRKIFSLVKILLFEKLNLWQMIHPKIFNQIDAFSGLKKNKFHFISLSDHITKNIQTYFQQLDLNIVTITLPTNFSPKKNKPHNKNLKVATFGYGDSLVLQNILLELNEREINSDYEIRIIGMDSRGCSDFKNVTSPSNGTPLSRLQMEQLAEDIDLFLILYDQTRYRLSCSGSILEAISYRKPVLHFSNECIENFNNESYPIGISARSLSELADILTDLINNYESRIFEIEQYRTNIDHLRDKLSINTNLERFRKSLTFK